MLLLLLLLLVGSGVILYILRLKTHLQQCVEQRQRSEMTLRTLSTAVEQSIAAVVITDLDASIRYVNPQFTRVTGYGAPEVLGHKTGFLGSGLTDPAVFAEMWGKLAMGSEWSGEFINRRKNGEIYYEEAHMSPVLDAEGRTVQYVAVKLDISERKIREIEQSYRQQILELLASGASLQVVLNALVNGVESSHPSMICSILLVSDDGKHLLTGAAPSLPDFFSAAVHGLEIGDGVGSCGTAAFTGCRVVVGDIQQDPYWAPYRELAAQAGLAACWSEPIRSTTGAVVGTFAIYHRQPHLPSPNDIQLIEESAKLAAIAIDQSRANEALLASERNYRFIYEAAPLAFILVDSDNCVVGWNRVAESMFGWQMEEILKQPVDKLIYLEDQASFFTAIKSAWASGEVVRQMSRNLTAHGETIICEWSNAVQKDASGKTVGLLCLVHDVTAVCNRQEQLESMVAERTRDLLKAKEGAERANRVKSEFIANLSHEIKTPLNGIIGMTDLTLDTRLDDEQWRYLSIVKEAGRTLTHLIDGMLDFSLIEGGKLQLTCSPLKLVELIGGEMENFRPRAKAKGLQLALACAPEVPAVLHGDPAKLGQIIAILLDNAIKFTERGEVSVRVDPVPEDGGESRIQFSVADTGIGIAVDKQQTIFEPFTQVDGSASRSFGGVGLGLALCARLVDAMGGKLEVDSEPRKGSIFKFSIAMPAGELVAAAPAEPHFDYSVALQAADRELLEIIGELFIDTWPVEIAAIRTAIAGEDRGSLRLKAHSLKGNLAMFNAEPAQALAWEIEQQAVTGNPGALLESLQRLEQELQEFQTALQAFLPAT